MSGSLALPFDGRIEDLACVAGKAWSFSEPSRRALRFARSRFRPSSAGTPSSASPVSQGPRPNVLGAVLCEAL